MELKDVKIDVEKFREAMVVDKNALDVQWEDQSSLYFEYVEISSACSEVIDGLKDELNVLEAETDLKIRSNPEDYNIEKVSESAIKAAITCNKKVAKRKKALHEWMYYDRILKGALNSIDQRKRALTKLSDLFIAGYFAEPKSHPVMDEKVEQRKQSTVKKTLGENKRLKKRSKK